MRWSPTGSTPFAQPDLHRADPDQSPARYALSRDHRVTLRPNFKQTIVNSDGHDTTLNEIPDIVSRTAWPGAMSRTPRNRFIEQWAGREWDLRRWARSVFAALQAARVAGDAQSVPLFVGQDAGLIDSVLPTGELIRRVVEEAEKIITDRLPAISRVR
jgi:NAD(P)H-dependent flavin oxidoreductase YrpB (nitropropane dioxygenase family)